MYFKEMKIKAIKKALQIFEGDKKKASEYLGISLRSMRNYCRFEPELRKFYRPKNQLLSLFEKYKTEEEAYAALQDSKAWKYASVTEKKDLISCLESYFLK